MHFRKIMTARGLTRLAVILAALGLVAAATPARAAGDEDYEGWYVSLDAALTQPLSLDQHYANFTPPTTGGTTQSERLVLKNDADLTGAIKFGYGFGKGMGKLQVSFWAFDNEDKTQQTLVGTVYPSLFGYAYRYPSGTRSMYLMDTTTGVNVEFKAKTKATTLDVDYLRSYAVGQKTAVTWLAGLRSATYQEIQDFTGSDAAYTYTQHKDFKSNALGLKLGAMVHFGFTQHFGMDGSAAFSFLQADTKGNSNQFFDPTTSDTAHVKNDNIRGEIQDFDLKAVWNYGMMEYFIGYSMSNWSGMVADPLPAKEGLFGSPATRDSIAFNSLHAGVTFKFGSK